LLTGNLERCARAKLEPLGLNPLFGFGAFGSDHEDRNRLLAIAVARASQGRGDVFDVAQIVIVGDSVQDVRCGRGFGARTIAVASGKTTRATLAAEEPDILLDDLLDAPRAHRAIMNE
jgi:phosphoglycolate phosphatase